MSEQDVNCGTGSMAGRPQHDTPCGKCPFRRTIAPGALGGSPPEKYVGQAAGSFWLPCHMTYTSRGKFDVDGNRECAGAAIFRANVGVLYDAKLLHLPADPGPVFASFEEFYAHHYRVPVEEAERRLSETTPDDHCRRELEQAYLLLRRRTEQRKEP